jgi:HlyD family secretion protein
MRTVLKLLLVLVLVGGGGSAFGYGGWYLLYGRHAGPSFRTAVAEKGNLLATISATGTIEPEEVIDVGAQVAAQIKFFGQDPTNSARTIDYGSIVHGPTHDKDGKETAPGTLLAQLDDNLFKARVDQTQAAVEVARAAVDAADANLKRAEADLIQMKAKLVQSERDFRRGQRLIQSHTIADVDYDTMQAAFETAKSNLGVDEAAIVQAKAAKIQAEKAESQAEANLAEARVNLGYTQIRSPVEGVIVDRRVNVGQTVVAGLNAPSLFLIAKDLKRLQVWASVNEADIGNIHAGQNVTFTVDAYPNRTFTGIVGQIRLNASMTQNVVTYTVVVNTDNSDGKLLPYLTANLQFQVAEHKDVLLVPNAALRWKPASPWQVAPDAREDWVRLLRRKAGEKAAAAAGEAKPKPAGPEKETHDRAVVWVQDGAFVRPAKVQIGLSDGANTEVVKGDLEPGATLVIGENHAGGPEGTTNPFTPQMFGGGQQRRPQ